MIFVITGGCGFIGRYVVRHLAESGFEVIVPTSTEWRLGQLLPVVCDQADVVTILPAAC